MKTKNLMTAFALSAMFAACSQDVELNEAIAKNDFSDIPMVEAEFIATTGVESRLANKRGWEVDDIIGFAYLGDDNVLSWTGVAYGNHPLYCTDATAKTFKGETMYYEGKYFSYLPYADDLKKVGYVPFTVKGQTLSTSLDDYAKKMIYISPNVVTLEDDKDAEYKAGRGNNIALKLLPFNNAAIVDLNFKNIENLADLKVTKIEISVKNATGTDILPMSFNYAPSSNVAAVQPTDWANVNVQEFFNYVTDDFSASNYGVLTLTSEEGLAVTNNALSTYALLLPVTGNHGDPASMSITVTTNYGTMTAEAKVKAKAADQYATVSASTPLFKSFNQTGYIAAEFDAKNIVVGDKIVATQAELEEYLNLLVATKVTEEVTITAKPATANAGKTFILNDFTFPANLKAKINLTTDDTKANTIVFAGNTVVNYPVIVKKPVFVEGTMTVEHIKNASYTFNCVELTVDHDAVLINNGVFSGSIETVAADEDNELGFGKYISNDKEAKLINGSTINNYGEAQWIAGTAPTLTDAATNNLVYAVATDLAGIEAADNASVSAIRLLDGAWIGNNTEAIQYSNISIIECYGNVDFYVTDTPRGAAQTFGFPHATIYVMENATVSINSDNKNNIFETGDAFGVKKNAALSISNINCQATIHNEGSVSLYNVNGVNKGTQSEGSSWISTDNN